MAAPPATISGAVDPIATLDALLAEPESTTVQLDELDDDAVTQLEQLADKLEAAAASLGRVGSRSRRPSRTATTSKPTASPSSSGRAASHVSAARDAALLLLRDRLVRIAVAPARASP